MAGPGQYVADVTEGIIRVEDLPKPKIVKRSRNYKHRRCADCEHSSYRVRTVVRTLHDLDDPAINRPRDIQVTYSQHYCCRCDKYFNAAMGDLALPKSHYTLQLRLMCPGWCNSERPIAPAGTHPLPS